MAESDRIVRVRSEDRGGPVTEPRVYVGQFPARDGGAGRVAATLDTEQSQHHSMPELRRALGLPEGRPSRGTAQERMEAWMAELMRRGGD